MFGAVLPQLWLLSHALGIILDYKCTSLDFLKLYFQLNQESKIMYTILIEAEELLVATGQPNTIIFDVSSPAAEQPLLG